MREKISAIVLAAGKGKRMRSSFPKVLQDLKGRPLIWYVLKNLTSLKYINQIIVVLGYRAKDVQEQVNKEFKGIEFVCQKEILGTAHAVKCTKRIVKNKNVLVICADTPLITKNTLYKFVSSFLKSKSICSLIVAYQKEKTDLGRIVRDREGKIMAIKEKIELKGKENFREINSGIYCFKKELLFENLDKIKKNKRKKEYFLTQIIEIFYRQGYKIDTYLLDDEKEILGVNTKRDLLKVEKILQERICGKFIEKGVKIVDPQTTFINEEVKIGKDTTIFPFTFIEKDVIIGNNCLIGPFIHLREGTKIEDNTNLGNFLEICRSRIGKEVKIKHFGYIGDTTVEDKVNIGAGVVVANFDGKKKNKTYIKEGAFIGSDTILIAPVKVEKQSITGAGSVVTKNVAPFKVVVGVPARALRKVEK
ncbi:MAG TPA: bifunctional N-acetylglucosamine-1-phosphate uridyltransferase/glucosamine-1-phosphate acetyltransferase [Candidatus Omnitrophica bacterium]|nr:bifunctional N-acetylglucosamine-1-phosphate uridyltransferase/glucosamine-1-phosphate acetyltransferase [Candidatus Omnitrophota bacterium]